MRRSLALALSLCAAYASAGDVMEHKFGDEQAGFQFKLYATAVQANACPSEFPFACYYRSNGNQSCWLEVVWTGILDIVVDGGGNGTGCGSEMKFDKEVAVVAYPSTGLGVTPFKEDFMLSKFEQAMQKLDPKMGIRGKCYKVYACVGKSHTGNIANGADQIERHLLTSFTYPNWYIFDCASDACKVDMIAPNQSGGSEEAIFPHGNPSAGEPDGTEVEPTTPDPNPMGLVEKIARYLFVPPKEAFDELKTTMHNLATWGPLGWVAAWSADLGDLTTQDIHFADTTGPYQIPFNTPFGNSVSVIDASPYELIIKCMRTFLLAIFVLRILPPFVRWVSKLV